MSSSCYFCLLLFMFFFHFCLSTQNFNHVLCKDDEREALLQFKHGLIDPANKLASWIDEKKDCCSWTGIVCDNFTGHVHQIRLRGAGGNCHHHDYTTGEEDQVLKHMLGGDLSPSLVQLQQLVHLDLSCNDFGRIQVPRFMGSLKNLRYLNLSTSNFGGIVPSQLGNLSKLEVLDLRRSFDDVFDIEWTWNMQWLSSLRLLHYLDMSGRDLSEPFEWFQVINSLPSLAELHLSNCGLLNVHPHVSSLNITSLSLLDLSFNGYSNSPMPRWIFSLTSLVSLDLSWCYFQGRPHSSIDSFRNLTSLKFLSIAGNDFMGSSSVLQGLSSIGSNLISLDISFCAVSSSGLASLHNLTSLLSLDLSNNQLTKAIPKSWGNLCNLREIDMSNNNFHNISLTYFLERFLECKSSSLESLFLSSSRLSGHLPDQLGRLIHLIHLDLGQNNIFGIIPDWIGGLALLEMLDLSQNRLNGILPASLSQLSQLDRLDLSYNQLNGHFPNGICQLSKLDLLDLSYNKLNGSLPDCIGQLPKLDRLDLSNNQLNGGLPHSVGQLSKLHSLDFSSNLLTGVVTEAHFANLTRLRYLKGSGNNLILKPHLANWIPVFQLQYLYLNSWGLGPQFPMWLQSQRDLTDLDISNTNISAPLPHLFWRSFPNLNHLDMSQNHIQGTLFSIPAALDTLILSSNNFTGQLPDLSNSSSLRDLDLSYNVFVGALHDLFCPYAGRQIELLNLGNNHLTGVVPECWVKWSYLESLNLENNILFGRVPRTLGFLPQLNSLNLRGNRFSGRLPDSLMNLRNLQLLLLGRNELVGSIPTWLGRELRLLRSLDLRSNIFYGNIPQELCYLTDIHILDLAHNNLSGNIPRCFNNFNALSGKESGQLVSYKFYSNRTTPYVVSEPLVIKGREDMYSSILGLVMMIDLSSNNFVGHIPSELTILRELKSLNLSRNHLTGRIPETIGDMKSLESFDLSLNKLSGELPTSLSSLSFLSNFNVSNNDFRGRIPSSTQLQSFNETSFFGNNLCGDPLTKPCVVPVPYKEQEKNDGSHGADWGLIISMVLGIVVGFWIIVGPVIVSRSWRIAYFGFLTRLRYMVYDIVHKYCCN